jgi:hypothetical protein
MKKLKMIVTSVVVLAIVGSAFAFNAKKIGKFCVSTNGDTTCDGTFNNSKRVSGTNNAKYIVDWDGVSCTGLTTCTVDAHFEVD